MISLKLSLTIFETGDIKIYKYNIFIILLLIRESFSFSDNSSIIIFKAPVKGIIISLKY